MTTAAIRVDADRERGFGHLERCVSLAAKLEEEGMRPTFVTREGTAAVDRLVAHGIRSIATFPDREDEADRRAGEVDAILSRGPALVIFDIGSTAHDLVAAVKGVGCFVASFEDLGDGRYLSDLVIDANLTAATNPVRMKTPTEYLLGPEYAVLSPGALAAKKAKRRKGPIRTVIVTCGGSDPAGVTPRVIEGLSFLDSEIEVEVVLGPAFAHPSRLDEALMKCARTMTIVSSPPDLPQRLRRAHVGIISGGVTLFEAAYLGLPSVVVAQNQAQLRNLPPFESGGGIVNLGLASNNPTLPLKPIMKMLESEEKRRAMSEAMEKYVDGRGLDRIAAAIKEVLGK